MTTRSPTSSECISSGGSTRSSIAAIAPSRMTNAAGRTASGRTTRELRRKSIERPAGGAEVLGSMADTPPMRANRESLLLARNPGPLRHRTRPCPTPMSFAMGPGRATCILDLRCCSSSSSLRTISARHRLNVSGSGNREAQR